MLNEADSADKKHQCDDTSQKPRDGQNVPPARSKVQGGAIRPVGAVIWLIIDKPPVR